MDLLESNPVDHNDITNTSSEYQCMSRAEFALSLTIDHVMKHLNIRDVCRAGQVCKFWNEAANYASSIRPPEIVVVPDMHDFRISEERGSKLHVGDILTSHPEILIFFVGPGHHMHLISLVEDKILTKYQPQIPHRIIIIGYDKVMVDETEIRSFDTQLPFVESNGTLALSIPKFRQSRIRLSYCESHEYRVQEKAHRIVDELLPDSEESNPTFLLFGRVFYGISKEVINVLKQRMGDRRYTVWGGTTPHYFKTTDCRTTDWPAYQGMEGFIGLCITGDHLVSYSGFIDLQLARNELEPQFEEFRNSVKLKKQAIGLITASREQFFGAKQNKGSTYRDIVQLAKVAFPSVKFIVALNSNNQLPVDYFGRNSYRDASQEMKSNKHASILILTND